MSLEKNSNILDIFPHLLQRLRVNKALKSFKAMFVLLSVSAVLTSPLSPPLQHIDKVFKHKEVQQQLMDAKLQRITEMMREVEEKQQRERDFVSQKAPCVSVCLCVFFCLHFSSLSWRLQLTLWINKK